MKFDTVNLDGIALNYAVAKATRHRSKSPRVAIASQCDALLNAPSQWVAIDQV